MVANLDLVPHLVHHLVPRSVENWVLVVKLKLVALLSASLGALLGARLKLGTSLSRELSVGCALMLGSSLGSTRRLGCALSDGASLGSTTQTNVHPVPQHTSWSEQIALLSYALKIEKQFSSSGSLVGVDEDLPQSQILHKCFLLLWLLLLIEQCQMEPS